MNSVFATGSLAVSQVAFNAANRLVLLGDIHGQWDRVQPILDHEFPEGNGVALAVGDLVNYPHLQRGHHIYFIHGNHEDFHLLSQIRSSEGALPPNYTSIFAGDFLEIAGLKIAGLPGVFSEHFSCQKGDIPLKYFSREAAEKMVDFPHRPDVLLMHEAPRDVGFEKNGEDYGQPILTDLIAALDPALVLFGHHHMTFDGALSGTKILGLDYPRRSYGVLEHDPKTRRLRVIRRHAELVRHSRHRQEFRYLWTEEGFSGVRLFGGDLSLDKEDRVVR